MQTEVAENTVKMFLLLHAVNIFSIICSLYESMQTQKFSNESHMQFFEHESTGACVGSMRRLQSFRLRLMNN